MHSQEPKFSSSRSRPRRLARWGLAAAVAAGAVSMGVAAAMAASPGPTPTPLAPKPGTSAPAPPAPGRGPGTPDTDIDGSITAASPSSLTVKDVFGLSKTYSVGSATKAHEGPATTIALSALHVGEHVHVRGQQATSGGSLAALDIDIRLAHIDGVVTSISGSVLAVTDRDGFSRKVVTSANTVYRKHDVQLSASALTTGSVIHAEGTVDRDSTSLDAERINIELPPGS